MPILSDTPPTRVDPVVDNLHGHWIEDPYRWLEEGDSPETFRWVEEQNSYTRSLLDRVEGRDRIQQRLSELLSVGLITTPVTRDGRQFFMKRSGLQNQPALYMREGDEERLLVDPNKSSAEGMLTLDWWYPSWDGRLLAYGISANGDEWSTLFILDLDTDQLLPDRIERTRHSSIAWLPDKNGFYYTRYPHPGEAPSGDETYYKRVFFHALGVESASDPEIHVANLEKEHLPFVSISRDGRYLLVTVYMGSSGSRTNVYLRDLLDADGSFIPVAVDFDAAFFGVVVEGMLYLRTNLEAPNYRLLKVEASNPAQEHWREIIPERSDAVLVEIMPAGGQIVGQYLRNATSSLAVFDTEGGCRKDVELPGPGTVTAVSGEWDSPHAFYGFESFTVPPTIYRLEIEAGKSSVWAALDAPVQSQDYVVSQEWYTSRDGTRVSMFLVHRNDLDRSRPHPTLLTGYGGFNLSRTPLFSSSYYLWLEHGGILALPNLRGGGEYGEQWHRGGMLERKQNVFDDFVAAAEFLIEQGYATANTLAILGGSNGGLLVGAALTQHPELFRAVICAVPLLDMVRYHLFLLARLWIPEYGSADDPDQFQYLYAYSPYHHVQDGTAYPAVLLLTAESDTRVHPSHARKMAARLQAANASSHPILLRVETRAGHGIGKPISKVIEEQTDIWGFLFQQFDIRG